MSDIVGTFRGFDTFYDVLSRIKSGFFNTNYEIKFEGIGLMPVGTFFCLKPKSFRKKLYILNIPEFRMFLILLSR